MNQPRNDGVHPYAVAGEVPGHGQGHAHYAALAGGIGQLADLALHGGDGGGVDDDAAAAVTVDRLIPGHLLSRKAGDVQVEQRVL